MVGCPDSECHNRVDGHSITLFGKDGLHGIAGAKGSINELKDKINSIRSCVSKKTSNVRFYITLAIVISTSIGLVTPFAIKVMDAWSQEKEITYANKMAIMAQRDINNEIKRDIADIKNKLTVMQTNRKELLIQIGQIVKKAVKEANDEKK